MRPRTTVVASLGLALLIGFAVTGRLIIRLFRDLDPSAWPAGNAIHALLADVTGGAPVVAPLFVVASVAVLLLAIFFWVRASIQKDVGLRDPGRRSLLTGALGGAATAVGAGALATAAAVGRSYFGIGNEGGRGWKMVFKNIYHPAPTTAETWKDEWRGARIRDYRTLGRTGWKVSDIALGSARISGEKGENIVRAAFDRGLNYVDTAPDYAAEGSEQAIGRALQGRRDQVFLATKFCTTLGNLPAGTPVADYMAAIDGSLRRLQTDYVDLVHIHACDSRERLLDPNVHEAFDRLREAGKVRFMGFSSHTPNLEQVVDLAIESDRFDVMMLAYHHGNWPSIGALIERASRERDMGIVAMKTLKGARHHGLLENRGEADAYTQAALGWVLENPRVSAAIISFAEYQHLDEYLFASGTRPTLDQRALLEKYDQLIAGTYCPPHCGACLSACPVGLAVHDVLRFRMYFEDYGWEKDAMRQYASLETQADACAGCPAPCSAQCPEGIDIRERASGAHELLTIA